MTPNPTTYYAQYNKPYHEQVHSRNFNVSETIASFAEDFKALAYPKQLTYLLLADIGLSLLYGFTPTTITFVRIGLAGVQLVVMAYIMYSAVKRFLETF